MSTHTQIYVDSISSTDWWGSWVLECALWGSLGNWTQGFALRCLSAFSISLINALVLRVFFLCFRPLLQAVGGPSRQRIANRVLSFRPRALTLESERKLLFISTWKCVLCRITQTRCVHFLSHNPKTASTRSRARHRLRWTWWSDNINMKSVMKILIVLCNYAYLFVLSHRRWGHRQGVQGCRCKVLTVGEKLQIRQFMHKWHNIHILG